MSLASLAAAATVYDTIEDVARDTGYGTAFAKTTLRTYNIASVSDTGNVTMSEHQSKVAAAEIDNAERFGR